MKKIVILTAYNPTEGSGIEKVMNEVGKALNKSGKYNVSYIFSGDGKSKKDNGILYKSIKVIKLKGINYIMFCLKLPKYIKLENPDLIIDNLGSSFFFLLFNKKKGAKLISVCHGTTRDFMHLAKFFHFDNLVGKIKYYLFSFYNYLTSSYCIKKSDLIVTLSKDLKSQIIKKYGNNNVAIIYNGYDPKDIKIKEHDGIKVLFISNDHARKGIDILEDVANHYIDNDSIKFYVIGSPYNSLHKNIISKGKMKRDELYNFMAESDVIFLPSYCEGQPLVIFEAMGFGCIPVISKECHMDMLYSTPFEKYISEENSAKDYIKQIDDILNQKNLYLMRTTAKESISGFTWDAQAREYLNLTDKFLNN